MNNDGPLAGLRGGQGIRFPDAQINVGSTPLPTSIPAIPAFNTPDGQYNAVGSLLPGGIGTPYAYGTSARISTQTQQAHPNRVQLIIAKLYLPAPESDGTIPEDPVLQHALSDGDLAFTLRLPPQTYAYGSQYCVAPYGFAAKAVPLVNLATVNYLLWGLQVGFSSGPNKSARWRDFFRTLVREGVHPDDFRVGKRGGRKAQVEQRVWNFIRTFFYLFGVQHGGDQQGGMHETDGGSGSIVTHGAVDYVSSYAIEGKLRHINNYWRDYDVRENDDLILALRYKRAPHPDLQFVLSSSVRATRNERCPVSGDGFFYLRPEVLPYRSFSEVPYIHVARAMNYCSTYTRGLDACCWDARMAVTPGAPLHGTFEPMFVNSDRMFYREWGLYRRRQEEEEDDDEEDLPLQIHEEDDETDEEEAQAIDRERTTAILVPPTTTTAAAADAPPPPPAHMLSTTTKDAAALKTFVSKTTYPKTAPPAAAAAPPPTKKARPSTATGVIAAMLGPAPAAP